MEPTSRNPLRLWPGVAIAIVMVIARYVVPLIAPDAELFSMPLPVIGVFVAILGAAAIVIWWMFFSRARWSERLAAVLLIVVAVFAMRPIVHASIRGGMMGMMLPVLSVPTLCLALVVGALIARRFAGAARLAVVLATILLSCAPFLMIRTAGVHGAGGDLHWRWTPTPEERLLAYAPDEPTAPAAAEIPPPSTPTTGDKSVAPAVPARPDTEPSPNAKPVSTADDPRADFRDVKAKEKRVEWPGFRGPERDGIVRQVRIDTNWSQSPPVEMWRRPIGPGWSSFAVDGDLLYTQEQRGEDEIVACYRVSTGAPVWRHRDRVRFWESNAGAGPRATPTLHNGRIYAMGATGIVSALDARNGARVWSRNATTDTGKEIPIWGFASSPLAIDDLVVIAVAGQLIAYDAATGNQRWIGQPGGGGYASPHLATIDGVTQVLLQRGARTISVAPSDGTLLWEHSWDPSVIIVQPALVPGGVIITIADAMGGQGMRRLAVSRGSAGWTVQERWTSRGLKPYFNDFVVHKGYAYGFDGSILSSVDIETGERKWKGGRYGNGQLVLLSDQDVLLVISEEGELALVSATPDKHTELARFKAIEGKTWNHPVVVRDVLLVRNGEEMAAFRLPIAGRVPAR